MGKMNDNFIDLVVTSPPYDNIRKYEGFSFDFEKDFKLIAKELYRILKPGGTIAWIVGDQTINGSETLTSFKQAIYFKDECGFFVHDTMIYEKTGISFPNLNRYNNIFEYMFIFSKGKIKTTNLIQDKLNKHAGEFVNGTERGHDGSKKKMNGEKVGRLLKTVGIRNNIWRYANGKGLSSKDDEAFKHPAIFPEKLARDHIFTWSNPKDIVYDPFMGSGTTAKMCILLNRKWVGSEVSEKYCKIIKERINGYEYHPELFT